MPLVMVSIEEEEQRVALLPPVRVVAGSNRRTSACENSLTHAAYLPREVYPVGELCLPRAERFPREACSVAKPRFPRDPCATIHPWWVWTLLAIATVASLVVLALT